MNADIDIRDVRLETDRLILREWHPRDVDDLYEYASVPDGRVNHFIEGRKTFAIVYKENNKVIGSLGIEEYGMEEELSEFFDYRGREIGYVLSKDYWGRGLMSEAVKRVIAYLFDEMDFDFLLCGHFDKNKASARVQEKCGFLPYRELVFDTALGTKEPGELNLLINPKKNIRFAFSHPETLIYKP